MKTKNIYKCTYIFLKDLYFNLYTSKLDIWTDMVSFLGFILSSIWQQSTKVNDPS